MRITGGTAGGRILGVPKNIRPTQDMVRQALFSMIGGIIDGASFLDLYAGSGAVGLDAWSRGAGLVVCVEQSKPVFKTLQQNITVAGADAVKAIRGDVLRYIRGVAGTSVSYDVIFADPPYLDSVQNGLMVSLMDAITNAGILACGGLFIMEERAGTVSEIPPNWTLERERKYGSTMLKICRRVS